MNGLRYLIPRRIPQRAEIVPGIGGQEMVVMAIAVLLAALWGVAAWLLHVNLLILVLPIMLLLGGSFFLVKPLPDGTNLWALVLGMREFLTHPRRYLYAWDQEDY